MAVSMRTFSITPSPHHPRYLNSDGSKQSQVSSQAVAQICPDLVYIVNQEYENLLIEEKRVAELRSDRVTRNDQGRTQPSKPLRQSTKFGNRRMRSKQKYSTRGLSKCLEDLKLVSGVEQNQGRVIARVRTYQTDGTYTSWKYVYETDLVVSRPDNEGNISAAVETNAPSILSERSSLARTSFGKSQAKVSTKQWKHSPPVHKLIPLPIKGMAESHQEEHRVIPACGSIYAGKALLVSTRLQPSTKHGPPEHDPISSAKNSTMDAYLEGMNQAQQQAGVSQPTTEIREYEETEKSIECDAKNLLLLEHFHSKAGNNEVMESVVPTPTMPSRSKSHQEELSPQQYSGKQQRLPKQIRRESKVSRPNVTTRLAKRKAETSRQHLNNQSRRLRPTKHRKHEPRSSATPSSSMVTRSGKRIAEQSQKGTEDKPQSHMLTNKSMNCSGSKLSTRSRFAKLKPESPTKDSKKAPQLIRSKQSITTAGTATLPVKTSRVITRSRSLLSSTQPKRQTRELALGTNNVMTRAKALALSKQQAKNSSHTNTKRNDTTYSTQPFTSDKETAVSQSKRSETQPRSEELLTTDAKIHSLEQPLHHHRNGHPQQTSLKPTEQRTDQAARTALTPKTSMNSTYQPQAQQCRTQTGKQRQAVRTSAEASWTLHLNLGGKVAFHSRVVGNESLEEVDREMNEQLQYRQYRMANGLEPRLHVLLNTTTNASYQYHGVKMKAMPLEEVPAIDRTARYLAERFNQQSMCNSAAAAQRSAEAGFWSIGVDAIVYRDGMDHIGWHSDDTQSEETVLSLVVAAPQDLTRTVCIQSTRQPPTVGSEQIELFPRPGDVYEMDDVMQQHYVHSILRIPRRASATTTKSQKQCGTSPPQERAPPSSTASKTHRYALVFRRGRVEKLTEDNGNLIAPRCHLVPREPLRYIFGEIEGLNVGNCFSRKELVLMKAHQGDQRGISGNQQIGCNAIILSDESIENQKFQGDWLRYVASRRVGAGAIIVSQENKLPIRVFLKLSLAGRLNRSVQEPFNDPTSLVQKHACVPQGPNYKTPLYRYHGLYYVLDSVKGANGSDPVQFTLVKKDCCLFDIDDRKRSSLLLQGCPHPVQRSKLSENEGAAKHLLSQNWKGSEERQTIRKSSLRRISFPSTPCQEFSLYKHGSPNKDVHDRTSTHGKRFQKETSSPHPMSAPTF